VFKTIWRDVMAIGRNLRSVLIPINWKFNNRDQALRNWDMWGPLVRAATKSLRPSAKQLPVCNPVLQIFMLLLAATLAHNEQKSSQVFAVGNSALLLWLPSLQLHAVPMPHACSLCLRSAVLEPSS
jgi:hypothetical protein